MGSEKHTADVVLPVDQEDGAMLRGSCLGHLQAGSPLMIADGGGSV